MAFLHAVAHIEFTAILLAWDMAYRFRDLPEAFTREWLGVAMIGGGVLLMALKR